MGFLTHLVGKTVALDSAPLIYFVEGHPTFFQIVKPFFEAVQRGDISVTISAIAITEVLVHPMKQGNVALVDEFREMFLGADYFRTIPVIPEIAEIAAGLRATHGIRTPDALHAATAIYCNADFLLTNDAHFNVLPKPTVLMLSDLSA